MSDRILNGAALGCRLISLGRVDEQRGSLCVAEVAQHVPFDVHRTYWIFDVPPGGSRGHHAHREQTELLVALRGSMTVRCDDGAEQTVYTLDAPDRALLLPAMVYHVVEDFAAGSVCLVLASGPYDPSEYIYDYREFRALTARR